ncbi:SMP-30/gluconolactonase/LRE family protein [Bradyrhizobium genosp. P]|uniref:SMP-30/gluconolactonase/LRE family protein n=1 Tax=Bradyrhizobium genosp. P TaxID=83641 RepID=UPI003CEEA161
MRAGKIFRIDLDGKVTIVADVPSRPFGLGFLPDGDLLVASMTQRLILKLGADKPTIHADLTDLASGYLRDLAVARDGNAYVTSFDADAAGPDGFASARVLLAMPDGNIRSVADNIAHPNGLAITSSHELLVAETPGNRLLGFKIDSDGALLHRKVFANFEGMSPLGICEDAEGAVWAAAARQSLFVRVQQGGRITHRVHVPGRHAVARQLGEQDGRTLFCLTVAANLDDYPNRQQTARVEATAVDVPGAVGSLRLAETRSH